MHIPFAGRPVLHSTIDGSMVAGRSATRAIRTLSLSFLLQAAPNLQHINPSDFEGFGQQQDAIEHCAYLFASCPVLHSTIDNSMAAGRSATRVLRTCAPVLFVAGCPSLQHIDHSEFAGRSATRAFVGIEPQAASICRRINLGGCKQVRDRRGLRL